MGEPFDVFRGFGDGYSGLGRPGWLSTVTCYVDDVGRGTWWSNGSVFREPRVESVIDTGLQIDEVNALGCAGDANTQRVSWHAGRELYEMFVPLDGTKYNVSASPMKQDNVAKSGLLSCGATSVKDGGCIFCTAKMDHVQIMRPGSCTWEATTILGSDAGKHYIYTVDQSDGLAFIGTASYLVSISCKGPHGAGRDGSVGIDGDGTDEGGAKVGLIGRKTLQPSMEPETTRSHMTIQPGQATTISPDSVISYSFCTSDVDLRGCVAGLKDVEAKRHDGESNDGDREDADDDEKRGGDGFHAGGGHESNKGTAGVIVPLGVRLLT